MVTSTGNVLWWQAMQWCHSQLQAIQGQVCFLIYMFWVMDDKEDGLNWVCQIWWNNALIWRSLRRKGKMADLQKRQNDISHTCVRLLQCNPSWIVLSSYHPSQCKNLSSGSLRWQKSKSWNFWCRRSFKQSSSTRTFSLWKIFFSQPNIFYQENVWKYFLSRKCIMCT